jgi:acetolactate synthase-1/2/3 large subunit
MGMRHGGTILAEQLKRHGVERVFSIPGESFLAALDGLYGAGIGNTVARHEGGAAMMAEAWGKLTGRPGVVFVTRGPGATNAASGIHVARQDSTPMVVFVGQVPRRNRDREAFQEVDFRAFFGPLAKWVAEIDDTARLPEYIARAFHAAQAGRPGPVVLSLPEDMLSARAEVPDRAPAALPLPGVTDAQIAALTDRLAAAARPLTIAGGPGWSQRAAEDLARFAECWDVPVAAAFRRQDYMDNRHPCYAGDVSVGLNPALGQRVRAADCLLVLGARLSDPVTDGYRLIDPAAPAPVLLQVHPDPDMIGRVYPAAVAIAAPAPAVLARLAETAPPGSGWPGWRAAARADYEAWQRPAALPGAVHLGRVVEWLSEHLPEDAIVTNGAGNYAAFVHRHFRYKRFGTQLAPTSGSMGYGLPAAIAAGLRHPGRVVICFAGDGCFQMTGNELATARQAGAAPIVIVANNRMYGTIRMHQARSYPGRISGTELVNPDFAALARAHGGFGVRVTDEADFPGAFAQARAAGTLAVIELVLDPEAIATGATLAAIEAQAAG